MEEFADVVGKEADVEAKEFVADVEAKEVVADVEVTAVSPVV